VFSLRKPPPTWAMIEQWIEWRYPDVQHINTEELSALLQKTHPNTNSVRLIDYRLSEEFKTSRIKSSINFSPDKIDVLVNKLKREIPSDSAIVVYCSVGARSAEAVSALQAAGFTNVRNLRGSIFQWANEGRPLEGGSTVHPYDAYWGQLLDRQLHADIH
jgi:rhodanese-related sulfurtransferase